LSKLIYEAPRQNKLNLGRKKSN